MKNNKLRIDYHPHAQGSKCEIMRCNTIERAYEIAITKDPWIVKSVLFKDKKGILFSWEDIKSIIRNRQQEKHNAEINRI